MLFDGLWRNAGTAIPDFAYAQSGLRATALCPPLRRYSLIAILGPQPRMIAVIGPQMLAEPERLRGHTDQRGVKIVPAAARHHEGEAAQPYDGEAREIRHQEAGQGAHSAVKQAAASIKLRQQILGEPIGTHDGDKKANDERADQHTRFLRRTPAATGKTGHIVCKPAISYSACPGKHKLLLMISIGFVPGLCTASLLQRRLRLKEIPPDAVELGDRRIERRHRQPFPV